jgi:predicted Zn-dependent peptidase
MTSIGVSTSANGLRIATDTMDGVETVSVGVWIAAGSRYESVATTGVSHFLEHMVFKGTRRRDARTIAEEIEAVGGHLNAHTSREYTAFYAKVMKDDAALAVDVIADIVQNALLDEEELGRERTVVLQEIMQSLDTPDDLVFDRFHETAYPRQPIGRPVLGFPDLIRNMQRDTLDRYRLDHYGASRMVVAAAGCIEHEALVTMAEAAFGDLAAGDGVVCEPARYEGGDWREVRDLEQVHIILGFESFSYRDPDFYSLSVLSTLLGGGMSSRLFQEAREKRGLVYTIYTFPSPYSDGGLFGIYAGTGESEVRDLLPLVCDEILKVCDVVGEEEVARARMQLKASVLMARESTSARCEQLARQLMVFGRPLPVAEIVSRIDAVDRGAVVRAAGRLRGKAPTLVTLGPIAGVESYDWLLAKLR